MNRAKLAARAIGLWLSIQTAAMPFLLAHQKPLLIGGGALAVILLFWCATAWVAVPMLASVGLFCWAAFAPQNCTTWFGWIGLLFRLIVALIVSNFAWALSAVLQ